MRWKHALPVYIFFCGTRAEGIIKSVPIVSANTTQNNNNNNNRKILFLVCWRPAQCKMP